ncbi:DUF4114 domain-containing protein [Leptolyngbyaceae cyanobacterium CCMR0081]|uniref:DUF4114 domain-containing protein n=2 Tax=Adonisia TaxID=2950183 RepID=A0A6M0RMD0_9CYAN|nr:DUF4114 domain-containing protein [Adonisia turfae CCMR0081]
MSIKFTQVFTSCCAALMAATVFTPGAEAASLSKVAYEQQLGHRYGLSYAQWSLFNRLATNQEGSAISDAALNPVSLDDVTWETGVDNIEVFFINEGAAIRSQLFYSTDAGHHLNTIWNDIASPYSLIPEADGPLSLGQGKSLGAMPNGTVVDFFLQADGNLFGMDASKNPDGEAHIASYKSGEFLLLGFEDRIGRRNDRDFNDVVIAIRGFNSPAADVIPTPVVTPPVTPPVLPAVTQSVMPTVSEPATQSVPEPMGTAAVLGMGLFGLMYLHRP